VTDAKIAVLRDEGDALTAGNRNQQVVEERRLFVHHLPTFTYSNGGENTVARTP
jgi:hypothetical protein